RDPNFKKFFPLAIKNKKEVPVFNNHAMGIISNRDAWVYGFNENKVIANSKKMISNYNTELSNYKNNKNYKFNRNPKYIKWTVDLERQFKKESNIHFHDGKMVLVTYRPFTKKWLYFDSDLVYAPGQYYTKWGKSNTVLIVSGGGNNK
ncbi:type ISP restriction/modification enzyme, partial [Limosilactobacillus reuteri]